MTKVKNTAQCISNLADVLGTPVPIRIGGTTQSVSFIYQTERNYRSWQSIKSNTWRFWFFWFFRDYGTYDPNLTEAISYKLHPADKGVPKSLTYGPEFIRLASTIPGPVTIGLNRKSNNLPNAILASQEILRQIPGLYALEFGNEPECKQTLFDENTKKKKKKYKVKELTCLCSCFPSFFVFFFLSFLISFFRECFHDYLNRLDIISTHCTR